MILQVPAMYISGKVHAWESQWLRQSHLKRQKNKIGDQDSNGVEELKASEGKLGNYLFWITFCIIGQPICVLLYYRAWYMREHPELVDI